MNELEHFYISKEELMHRSYDPRYRGKPLAWVFYEMYLELPDASILSKFQNFYNKVSVENATFEVRLPDNSSFVIGNGKIQIFHPLSNFFESISIS